MNVGELIAFLEDYDPDIEVRLMTQIGWPLVFSVYGLWYPPKHATDREDSEAMYDEDGNVKEPDERLERILYIVEGGPPPGDNPYGDSLAWEECER